MPDDIHGEQKPPEEGPQPTTRPADQGTAQGEERAPADVAQQEEEHVSDAAAQQESVAASAVLRSVGPAGEEVRRVAPAERRRMNRRELLKLVPVVALGAFAVPKLREPLLNGGLHLSDWASGKLFGRTRLAQTFRDSDVVAFQRFPYNFYDVVDPGVDLERWTLVVEGLVERPGKYKLAQIQALPKVTQNTRHVCVEGWDVIGNFGGTRASDLLRAIGADTSARFLEAECADGYYESIDMETMLHPQTLFCYEMYGKPLDRGHGAPLRLQMPTKIGYKQAKYLDTIRVTNVLSDGKRGYWEDQGYSWYGGL
ncbi:MAG: molybdopterin-dependent oxidoreductase [Terriglobales bacterium]